MKKRKIDDIDGMLDDIREGLFNNSKSELIDMVMDAYYGDKVEDEDVICDFSAYYGDIDYEI